MDIEVLNWDEMPIDRHNHFVYLFACIDKGFLKIGKTWNPKLRKRQLERQYGKKLTPVAIIIESEKNAHLIEKMFHFENKIQCQGGEKYPIKRMIFNNFLNKNGVKICQF